MAAFIALYEPRKYESYIKRLDEAGRKRTARAGYPFLHQIREDQADRIVANDPGNKPCDPRHDRDICRKSYVSLFEYPPRHETDAPASAFICVLGHLGAVHQNIAGLVVIDRITLASGKYRYRNREPYAQTHHEYVLFGMLFEPCEEFHRQPHHEHPRAKSDPDVLRGMDAQEVAADSNEHCREGERDPQYARKFLSYRSSAVQRACIRGVTAREGVPGRSLHGLGMGYDARIPDPRTVCAGRHLEQAVDHSASCPAHKEVPAVLLADAPVDDRNKNQHRAHLADETHLHHERHKACTCSVPEFLPCQQYLYIQDLTSPVYRALFVIHRYAERPQE